MRSIEAAPSQAMDAVVVADYGKGFLTQPLADYLCRRRARHGKSWPSIRTRIRRCAGAARP